MATTLHRVSSRIRELRRVVPTSVGGTGVRNTSRPSATITMSSFSRMLNTALAPIEP